MGDIKEKYKKIMSNLEKNVDNEKDLNYIKKQVTDLFMIFLDKLDEITDKYEFKMNELKNSQNQLDKKFNKLEESLKTIEKDLYIEENNDFEIVCPYCNSEFIIEFNSESKKDEIQCPDCKNIIELDWNEGPDSPDINEKCCSEDNCLHCISEENTEDNKQTESEEDDM